MTDTEPERGRAAQWAHDHPTFMLLYVPAVVTIVALVSLIDALGGFCSCA